MSKNRNFRTPLLPALLVLGLIAPAAQAATVILDPTEGSALGIQDLPYGGLVYDVTFVPDTLSNIYGAPPNLNLDFTDSNVADEVVVAVNAALNTSTAVRVGADASVWASEYRIAYDYNFSDGTFDTRGGESNLQIGGWITGQQRFNVSPDLTNDVYAVFAPVPIPAAVWLFGSGLLGLVGIARRRRG
jgi:hypothetical protein